MTSSKWKIQVTLWNISPWTFLAWLYSIVLGLHHMEQNMGWMTIRRQLGLRRNRYLLLLSLLLVYCVYYMVSHIPRYPDIHYLSNPVFLELDKCPACYGNSLCHKFYSGSITFDRYSRYRFLDKFNTKNVHYGLMDNKTKVMIKRLAHDVELSHFDDLVCKNASLPKGCNVSSAIYQSSFVNSDVQQVIVRLLQNASDMTRCPSQRLIDIALRNTQERKSKNAITLDERLQLITTVMINPETIIMQVSFFHHNNFTDIELASKLAAA